MTSEKQKIKNIKRRTVLLLIFTFIFLLLIPLIFVKIYNLTYKKTDSISDYLNNNYVSYNGGRDAQAFFESFVKIDGNKNISFKYRDNEMQIPVIRKNFTAFALDIEYEPECYSFHMNEIWNSTNMPDKNDDANYYGAFLMTDVRLNKYVYDNNYCGIFFDSEHSIIRYVFLYNFKPRRDAYLQAKNVIKYSIPLEWYENKSPVKQ